MQDSAEPNTLKIQAFQMVMQLQPNEKVKKTWWNEIRISFRISEH